MGRLTEGSACFMFCAGEREELGEDCSFYEVCFERQMYDKLKQYEDLEEAGRLIEQKHGAWEIHDEYYFCTNCYSEWKETFTYCPYCGSKNGEINLLKELEGDKE